MEKWHRCSRWTDKRIPCPYGGLELEELPERNRVKEPALVESRVLPLTQEAKAAATADVSKGAKAIAGAAVAQVNSPLHQMIEDAVSVKERAQPGAGPVPLWGDTPAIELAKAWTTPKGEHALADLIYANPAGPSTISALPLVGIRQSRVQVPTTPGDPLLQEPQKIAVRPTSKGKVNAGVSDFGSYPLMEPLLAKAMAGQTAAVPKVLAIQREAPSSIEQDAWNIQSQIAIVAGAVSIASIQTGGINPGNVAGHMERIITKAIPDKTTSRRGQQPNLWKNRTAGRIKVSSGGTSAGRKQGMKGGAFQTESIWDVGVGVGGSIVSQWERELRAVSGTGFHGTEG